MENSFGAVLGEMTAFEHVVPQKFRTRAKELAAIVLISGAAVDPDRLGDLVATLAPQHRSAAFAVIASFKRLAPKARDEIVAWARVLLVFRNGTPEEWERASGRKARRRR